MIAESSLIAAAAQASRISKDDIPKLGQWYWVKCKLYGHDNEKEKEHLMCAEHIASNHTKFYQHDGEHGHCVDVMHWEVLECTRIAPEWQDYWQDKSDQIQVQLKDAVKKLADTCIKANLIEDPEAPKVETLLPAVTRTDPKKYKKALIRLKKTTFPAREKTVKQLMTDMVGVQRNMFLSEHAQAEMLKKVVERVDDRLFALELYAGFHDSVKQIADGEPAPEETPITIRQLLRFMDEETLIDAEEGGMDFKKLEDFDEWAAANLKNVAPEERCIVAFQVRREYKDYGPCGDIGTAFRHCEWHEANKMTYLLIRNGQRAYRFSTEIDFSPRLLPLREEFNQPLHKEHYYSDEEKKPVTPQDVEYDDCLEKRTKVMMHYNRITFLLQGLLDRSKVFEPHPPMALNDPEIVEKYLRLKRDEEDGLPSFNPPSWEEYRTRHNKHLRPGTVVFARWTEEYWDRQGHTYRYRKPQGYYRVTRVSRDKKTVTINQPWGTRWGWQHRSRYGGYHGEFGEWEVKKRRHYKVDITNVFNVEYYTPGDYKQFLCDAYLKGTYMKWAAFLLSAERFHRMSAEKKRAI
jgi:hypothetical protein